MSESGVAPRCLDDGGFMLPALAVDDGFFGGVLGEATAWVAAFKVTDSLCDAFFETDAVLLTETSESPRTRFGAGELIGSLSA